MLQSNKVPKEVRKAIKEDLQAEVRPKLRLWQDSNRPYEGKQHGEKEGRKQVQKQDSWEVAQSGEGRRSS